MLKEKSNSAGYLLISPAFVILSVVYFYPLFGLIPMSVYRTFGQTSTFVGLGNYAYLIFDDLIVRRALLNNFKLLLVIPIVLVLSLFVSAVLFEIQRGVRFYQAIIFLPYLLSSVVSSIMFSLILQKNGLLNTVLRMIGLGFLALDWLGDARIAIFTVIGVMVWREMAFGSLLFLAQMHSLSEDVFDAARVDGVSWIQKVFFITIPQAKNLIFFFVIYEVIIVFSWSFNYVYVLTSGGPGFSTTILEYSIYQYAITKHLPHMAAALSVMLFMCMLAFIYIQFRLRRAQLEPQ